MEPSLFSKLELSSSEDPLLADEGGGTDVASIVAGIVGGTEAAKAAVLATDGTSGTSPSDPRPGKTLLLGGN